MSSKTRIRGICKHCTGSNLFHGGGGEKVTGVWCINRNGRIKNPPKECKWFQALSDNKKGAASR